MRRTGVGDHAARIRPASHEASHPRADSHAACCAGVDDDPCSLLAENNGQIIGAAVQPSAKIRVDKIESCPFDIDHDLRIGRQRWYRDAVQLKRRGTTMLMNPHSAHHCATTAKAAAVCKSDGRGIIEQ